MKEWRPARLERVRDGSIAVAEPDVFSEFEIQAHVYCSLRALGINARGEVKTQFAGRAAVRFDIAVFDDAGLLCGVIEVKKNPGRNKGAWGCSRQGARYAQFGVPVRLVCGMDDAIRAVADAAAGALWTATARQLLATPEPTAEAGR